MMAMEWYTLRVYSRGMDPTPTPAAEQAVVYEKVVAAIEGTSAELLGKYAVDPASPTLAVIATETSRHGGMGGAFWSPDETRAAVVVGIDIDLPKLNPLHGYRVEWERRP
jgi:hypothetical protein